MRPIIEALAAIAMTLVTAVIPIAVRLIMRRLKLDEDQALRDNLETALQAAAGLAYVSAARGQPVDTAIRGGAEYVAARMPATLAKVGADAGALGPMIEARLGKLLAADPTVQGPRS